MLDFRKIKPKDEDFLIHLYGTTRFDVHQNGHHLSREQKFDFYTQQYHLQQTHYKKNSPKANFKIVRYNNKDVGRLTYDNTKDELWILELSLLPEMRGKGIGKLIINRLETKAKKSLGLYVSNLNEAGLSFYKSLGFKTTESEFEYCHKLTKTFELQKESIM
ncbi:MAG: GNAT family N-acetyltransferase [Saprospiraceae bacterium]|nr:GNAT family N-acetyltransferase [Bacteroidia bacterium]NNE15072.1 GNAT family N-acetyltransferase [Saprospiraceae bacterium]NNL93263.1 GNAT family N-acetyltransferase [Saprospiraceae bacterium]